MEQNPYEPPKRVSCQERVVRGGNSVVLPGFAFLVTVAGAFFLVVIADNWRATIIVSLFPLPVGAVTMIYCRGWGFAVWAAAALVELLILYCTAIGWADSGFAW